MVLLKNYHLKKKYLFKIILLIIIYENNKIFGTVIFSNPFLNSKFLNLIKRL
jgi:hypothetical protein